MRSKLFFVKKCVAKHIISAIHQTCFFIQYVWSNQKKKMHRSKARIPCKMLIQHDSPLESIFCFKKSFEPSAAYKDAFKQHLLSYHFSCLLNSSKTTVKNAHNKITAFLSLFLSCFTTHHKYWTKNFLLCWPKMWATRQQRGDIIDASWLTLVSCAILC